jgi:pyrroloquinoline quinone (PQQ) biosynthesis protein C
MFRQPVLAQGVRVEEIDNQINIYSDGLSLELEFPDQHELLSAREFLASLQAGGNAALSDQRRNAGAFEELLYAENLLREGGQKVCSQSPGLDLIAEIQYRYHNKWLPHQGESVFAAKLHDGGLNRNQLIGWAIEYFHITNLSHDCISPAIGRSFASMQRGCLEFFKEEYRHDKLLIKALKSVGLKEEEVRNSIPLPYTQAMMDMLFKWSRSDILSFCAALFVFEGTSDNSARYIDSVKRYQKEFYLPEEFVDGQLQHYAVNAEGDHFNVSYDFFKEIDHVSSKDASRVARNIQVLSAMDRAMHENAFVYYGTSECMIPRIFEKLQSHKVI